MSAYTLRRAFETVSTAHAASDSVAERNAASAVREALAGVGDERVDDVTAEATDIYEFPSGPFDPYRVHVTATVTVTVDAEDESAAVDAGESAIDAVVAAADLDGIEYGGPATVEG